MPPRLLVGAAAVAVIAFVGVWFWDRANAPDYVATSKRAADCAFDRQNQNVGDESSRAIGKSLVEQCEKEGY